jgi:DNA mismatch endonuclease (patch repair protein)
MDRSEMMATVHSKDTQPEMTVRRLVFSLGYRYRLHRKDLPGKPDLVFPRRKKAIFVHGCFWHKHDCKGFHFPKSNIDYWIPKLERNAARDIHNIALLERKEWDVLVLWECELGDIEELKERIVSFLESS